MSSQGRLLRISISTLLLPELRRRGFEGVPLRAEESAVRELRRATPFGQFRRNSAAGADTVVIEFDPYFGGAFRIAFGTIPREGVMTSAGHFSMENAYVDYLETCYYMFQCPRLMWYFSLPLWKRRRASQSDYDELVGRVVPLVDEMELVFSGGAGRQAHPRYELPKIDGNLRARCGHRRLGL